jgi:ribosomal protein S18 acetylase RimI-like enzyme
VRLDLDPPRVEPYQRVRDGSSEHVSTVGTNLSRVCDAGVPKSEHFVHMLPTVRHAKPTDHARVARVIDDWWGGRQMRDMLPRLFFAHFRETSFVAEEDGELVGFLAGFLSQTYPDEAYIHFVGVQPDRRGAGLARELYERFFAVAREHGRSLVRCVTAPANEGSIRFHERLGFEVDRIAEDYDGSGESRVLFVRRI